MVERMYEKETTNLYTQDLIKKEIKNSLVKEFNNAVKYIKYDKFSIDNISDNSQSIVAEYTRFNDDNRGKNRMYYIRCTEEQYPKIKSIFANFGFKKKCF